MSLLERLSSPRLSNTPPSRYGTCHRGSSVQQQGSNEWITSFNSANTNDGGEKMLQFQTARMDEDKRHRLLMELHYGSNHTIT